MSLYTVNYTPRRFCTHSETRFFLIKNLEIKFSIGTKIRNRPTNKLRLQRQPLIYKIYCKIVRHNLFQKNFYSYEISNLLCSQVEKISRKLLSTKSSYFTKFISTMIILSLQLRNILGYQSGFKQNNSAAVRFDVSRSANLSAPSLQTRR